MWNLTQEQQSMTSNWQHPRRPTRLHLDQGLPKAEVVRPVGWSSEEDSDSETQAEAKGTTTPPKAVVPTADELQKEFKTCFKRWGKTCVAIDWKGHFPDLMLRW